MNVLYCKGSEQSVSLFLSARIQFCFDLTCPLFLWENGSFTLSRAL